jgi:transglutaminase-like putative cysteine protease
MNARRKDRRLPIALFWLAVALLASPVQAQFKPNEGDNGPKLDQAGTQRIKIGVIIKAKGGPCRGIVATVPVPHDWPEQQVQIVNEDITPTVTNVSYRMIGGTVKQMAIEIPLLPADEEARAVITFEIHKQNLLPPDSTSSLEIPKKLPRDLLIYTGPSPFIESKHPKIISRAKELVADKSTDWEKVEAMYDWVRDNVKYQNGELKGAIKALNDKTGDCEELSSLFIAMCRTQKIPARTVWVPGHCYPEFYLVDGEGKGYWFPCQAAGARAFGGIPEARPILQKGDNFRDPDRPKDKLRYVSEYLTGKGGSGKPKVKFVQEQVGS